MWFSSTASQIRLFMCCLHAKVPRLYLFTVCVWTIPSVVLTGGACFFFFYRLKQSSVLLAPPCSLVIKSVIQLTSNI